MQSVQKLKTSGPTSQAIRRARTISMTMLMVLLLLGLIPSAAVINAAPTALQPLVKNAMGLLPSPMVASAQADEGTITVVVNTIGSDDTFDFSSEDVTLDGIQLTTSNSTASSATITKGAGVYTITQDALTGWSLVDIEVDGDTDSGSSWTIANNQIVIDLDDNEDITVTWTNADGNYSVNSAMVSGVSVTSVPVSPVASGVAFQIVGMDFGDLPDADSTGGAATNSPNYNTNITTTIGASHVITPGLYLGTGVDFELDGQPSSTAVGDDENDSVTGLTDDEDGISFPAFTLDTSANIMATVVNTTGSAATLYAFIDWDGNGDFTGTDEAVTVNVPNGTDGLIAIPVDVPATADISQQLGARFRLSTDNSLTADGAAPNGEVEDYLIEVAGIPVNLGSLIWFDADGDGVQDGIGTEPGIADARVELFLADGVTPAEDITGAPVAAITTVATGHYTFTNLPEGDYVVQVTPPPGYILTAGGADPDDNVDTDSNGIETGSLIQSLPISLLLGTEPVTTDVAGDSNLSLDFGFYKPLSLGNYVWHDVDADGVQNGGDDIALSGAIVELFVISNTQQLAATDVFGDSVLSQTTDGSGFYSFENLPPGDYVVRVTPPAGYAPTNNQVANPEGNSNTDSNIDAARTTPASTWESGVITLLSEDEPIDDGDNDANSNRTLDFGFVAFDLALRKSVANTSDTPLVPGTSTVTFNLEIINQGQIAANQIVVSDATVNVSMFDGFSQALNPNGSTTGDAALAYTWNGSGEVTVTGPLAPGETVIVPITLQVAAAATQGDTLENYAEIVSATDDNDQAATDIDSTPEGTENNGSADPIVDNEVNDNGDTDEDDHDVAYITVDSFDLALIKTVESTSDNPVIPGTSTITFLIEVFNQGDVPVTAPITIVDYVDPTMFSSVDGNWSLGDANEYERVLTDDISPGDSITTTITLQIAGDTAGTTLTNVAEIADDGQPSGADIDSTPDSDNDEAGLGPVIDNMTGASGKNGEDEDDHDLATFDVPIFDLALVKTVASTSDTPIIPGTSTVTFDIVIYNQGTVTATDVVIVDYIDSAGYSYNQALNTGWSANTTAPTMTIPGPIGPGEIVTRSLILDVVPTATDELNNAAEIVSSRDEHGNEAVDIDSTPDSDDSNDGPPKDNFTSEDGKANPGVDDEDDHDINTLRPGVYDLALTKSIGAMSTTPILPNGLITYTIEIFNQGDITATAPLTIVDYLDTANFTLVSNTWNTDGTNPTFTVMNDIGPGKSEKVSLVVQVNSATAGETLTNAAEIADDGIGIDIDSTPDSSNDESPVKPGETTEDGTIPGQDEDDHDQVVVTVSEAVSVGSYVWLDANGDGVQNGENGLPGATVELFSTSDGGATLSAATDIDGSAVSSQVTGADGFYIFDNLAPGEYVVRVTAPAGYAVTTGGADPDDNADTDSNGVAIAGQSYVQSLPVTLSAGDEPQGEANGGGDPTADENSNLTVDFGFVELLSLGNLVWYDTDDDGAYESASGEVGIEGVELQLLNGDSTPYLESGAIVTTTTNAAGIYSFTDLPAGTYRVRVVMSNFGNGAALYNYQSSTDPATGATPDNDANNDDNGIGRSGNIITSGLITLSYDGEPITDGDASTSTNFSVDFGFVEPLSLGNQVWVDLDNSGTIDANEDGINGVTVNLYRDGADGSIANGAIEAGEFVTATTTDDGGYYLFDNLIVGDYVVEIPAANFAANALLEGYYSSDDRATPSIIGGDVDDVLVDDDDNGIDDTNPAANGIRSALISLQPQTEPQGETNLGPDGSGNAANASSELTADFGFVQPVTVGDRVWYDYNADGIQASDTNAEPGVENVQVNIFHTADDSPVTVDLLGNPVSAVTTSASGYYSFTNLPPGDYYVTFVTTTLPAGYIITDPGLGGDDTVDSDADSDTGQTPSTGFLASGEEALTVDMGIHALVSVGDRVWYDFNNNGVQDTDGIEDSAGVADIEVQIYYAGTAQPVLVNGVPLTDTTDANGNYLFEDLDPGRYFVEFVTSTLPAGYEITVRDVNDTTVVGDAVDSDADPVTGRTDSTPFLMGNLSDPTNSDVTLDMGVTGMVAVGDSVWYDNDRDGVYEPEGPDGIAGNSDDEQGVEGVVVRIYNANDDTPVVLPGASSPYTATTNADGKYLFVGLPPGDYYVEFDLATLPANYQATEQDAAAAPSEAEDSDANPSNGRTNSTGFLSTGDQALDLDMGIWAPITVGNRVWIDVDGDGTQDATETAGVQGVTVEIFNDEGASLGTTTTDVNGYYTFTNLVPDEYYIIFDLDTLSPSYVVSEQDVTAIDDAVDSDADPATGRTASTDFLFSNEEDLSLDMGVYIPVRVGDSVWYDEDRDGIQGDPLDEPGVENVTVTLYELGNSIPVDTTTTDNTGSYLFDGLPPSNYYVVFDLNTLPPVYVPTTPNVSEPISDTVDSDANLSTGATAPTGFLNSGAEALTVDMGILLPADIRIGDTVWDDLNADGVQDQGELGVQNVRVELFEIGVTDPISDTLTDVNGTYLFDGLPPGDYYVQFDLATLPAGYVVTVADAANPMNDAMDSDANPTTGVTPSTGPLTTGDEDLTLDMGLYKPASLSDFVWFDDNADGIQDPGEEGIQGVTVEIFNGDGTPVTNASGNPVGPTMTDVDGRYAFTDLVPGDYYVVFTPPTDHIIGPQDAASVPGAGNDTIDSDANADRASADYGRTATTTLISGENDPTWDASMYIPLALGNIVWFDPDNDGQYEPGDGEAGIANVVVELYDANNNRIMTTLTGANGYYLFDELIAGDYSIFIAPSNFEIGGVLAPYLSSTSTENEPNNGDVNNDNNGIGSANMARNGIRSGTVTLSVGDEPSNDDHNGHPNAGTIVAADLNTNLTVDFGFYEPLSLGNQVWLDANNNGVVDGNEAGLNGVVVNLYRDDNQDGVSDGAAIDSQTTANGGFYLFDNLPQGFYIVEIDADNFQSGRALDNLVSSNITAVDPNGDADDGDDNGLDDTVPTLESVQSATIELTVDGEPLAETVFGPDGSGIADDDSSNLTVDFGFYEPLSLGNAIWHDENNDGNIDGDESGIDDVRVNLYLDSNQDGVADGPALMSTVTADGGYYLFDDLLPNSYIIEVDAVNFQATNPLAGYLSSQLTEASPNDDVDSNDNGLDTLEPAVNGIKSGTVTLTPNSEPINETDLGTDSGGSAAPDSSNLTVDFGFFQPISIGDLVWNDRDADGRYAPASGETGVPNITVSLFNSVDDSTVTDIFGNAVSATTTNADGLYSFENLSPGDYYVVFDLNSLPANYVVTDQNATGATDEEDSDADATTGRSDKTGFLASGTTDLTLDMGVYLPLSVGDSVWYDYDIDGIQDYDDGESGVPDVSVTLFDADTDAPVLVNGRPLKTTTDENGNYLFTSLEPGSYYVQFDLDTLPEGYSVTRQNSGSNDLVDSDVYTATGTTPPTPILSGGDVDLSLDMGIYSQVAVGDYVWHDSDHDGQQDPNEQGVPGIQVTLYSTSTNAPLTDPANPGQPWTIETDANGFYLFDAVPVDGYYVVFDLNTLPEGYQVTEQNVGSNVSDSDADPNSGQTEATGLLDNGRAYLSLDMGIWKPISIGDRVWLDDDADGIQDASEGGVPNIGVTLFNADGTSTGRTTTTDANGNYLFEGLVPGSYYVAFDLETLPQGHVPTISNAVGISDAFDSDVDRETGNTPNTGFISSGQDDLTLDMGIVGPVYIGDMVWSDDNRDGVQDPGEAGVPGVAVALFNADGTPAIDNSGQPVSPVATDNDGNYRFENLQPGSYFVEFDLTTIPDGYHVSEANVGINDLIDSDASLSTGRTGRTPYLTAGEWDLSLDMGVHKPLGVRIGDYVWDDLNGDGVQTPGEPGMPGVTVELYTFDADGNGVSTGQTRVTDADGQYLFDELPAGDYYVVFHLDTLPDGYKVTVPNAPLLSDILDSDADPNTGETPSTGTLFSGQQNLSLDMGVYHPASLGDRVWLDLDADGIQEAGEPGMPGIVVELFNSDGSSTGKKTSTNGDGLYSFTDLVPGGYYVQFKAPSGYSFTPADRLGVVQTAEPDAVDSDAGTTSGRTPVTILTSGENEVTLDAGLYSGAAIGNLVWHDDNGDGIQDPNEETIAGVTVQLYKVDNQGNEILVNSTVSDEHGFYGFTELIPGDYFVQFVTPDGLVPTAADLGSNDAIDSDIDPKTLRTPITNLTAGEYDDSWDAGFVPPASLGNFVWFDVNQNGIMDDFESGIGETEVILYNEQGQRVAVTNTDSTGFYQFADLPPGNYTLEFIPPTGFIFTQQGVERGQDGFNSDADPNTGRTNAIALDVGENDPDWGAGLFAVPTAIDVIDEPNAPGVMRPTYYLPIIDSGAQFSGQGGN